MYRDGLQHNYTITINNIATAQLENANNAVWNYIP